MQVVSIDLGSNSFRVLSYDCKSNKTLGEYHKVVGLADGLINSGEISSEAINRVVEAINKSIEKLKYNPKKAVAVTTAAMRKAKNSTTVREYIKAKTGVEFTIIDGQKEANLTLLAVEYALKREDLDSDNFIVLDIGGGSTEIMIKKSKNKYFKSFDFGIVTLAQEYTSKELLYKRLESIKSDITIYLNSLGIDLARFTFVATAGTPTTVAAVKLGQDFFNYDKNLVNGTKVNLDDLHNCLELFRTKSQKELIQLVGKGRVEFVEVGIYIYQLFYEVLGKNESIVLDDGLREGVAINHCLGLV